MNRASPSQAIDHPATTVRPSPSAKQPPRRPLAEFYQVVIECRDEAQQRELFERLSREGLKLRLLVL